MNGAIFDKFDQHLSTDPTGNSGEGYVVAFAQSGNGTIVYSVKDGSSFGWATATISNTLLAANTWENLVFVFNASTDSVYGYLNGALVNQTLIPAGMTIGQNTMPLHIGACDMTSNGFHSPALNGVLDDIRLYDAVLNACSIDSLNSTINPATGVIRVASDNGIIIVYPNPTASFFNIQTTGQKFNEVIIADLMGRVVYDKSFTNQVDISGFAAGCYILTVRNNDGTVYRQKIVKE